MSDKTARARARRALEDARETQDRLDQVKQALAVPPDAETAEGVAQMIADAKADAEARSRELKDLAKAIKREIADWKAWFEALPDERTVEEQGKVMTEIGRLSTRIAAIEAELAGLEAERLTREAEAEVARALADGVAAEGERAEKRVLSAIRREERKAAKKAEKAEARLKGGKKS